jgi:hypothetical protein
MLPLCLDLRYTLLQLPWWEVEGVVLQIEETVRPQNSMDRREDGRLLGVSDVVQGVLRDDRICEP